MLTKPTVPLIHENIQQHLDLVDSESHLIWGHQSTPMGDLWIQYIYMYNSFHHSIGHPELVDWNETYFSQMGINLFLTGPWLRVTWQVSYRKQELLAVRNLVVSPPVLGAGLTSVLLILTIFVLWFSCCFFIFVLCLVPSIAWGSGLFILDCPFGVDLCLFSSLAVTFYCCHRVHI